MPGVSIHVVDVARGVVATGMEVELHAIDAGGQLKLIAKGRVGPNGLVNEPQLSQTFAAGGYVAVFQVARLLSRAGRCFAGGAVPRCRPLPLRHFRAGAARPPAVQMHAVGLFVLPRRLAGVNGSEMRGTVCPYRRPI